MKKLKNKKRIFKVKNNILCATHMCQLEYSSQLSQPELSVFICKIKNCLNFLTEYEDAGTGA